MALQPATSLWTDSYHLRQQKLLWHYSRQACELGELRSTIVEIIMALQPHVCDGLKTIHLRQQKLLWHYSQQGCHVLQYQNLRQQKLLWHYSQDKTFSSFGIHLRQQKLLWHYSPQVCIIFDVLDIYDSRNYYGIIAKI